MAAAKVMLNEVHKDLPVQQRDQNSYILRSIRDHNIIIASLPRSNYSIISAATVATQLSSFRSIRFSLMVSIGGGIPSSDADIQLGDMVVSKPTDAYGGVVQYDYGKLLTGGKFERSSMLNHPPQIILTALSKLQAKHLTKESNIVDFIAEIPKKKIPKKVMEFARPTQEDFLYQPAYNHMDTDFPICTPCDSSKVVSRPSRYHNKPVIHYGLIASASQLRVRLSHKLGPSV